MARPLLVITPTLGRATTLDETVEGVRRLGLPLIHVLACPATRVAELKARFSHCDVLEDDGPAAGLWGGLNRGLETYRGQFDWFTFINDDDGLLPGFAAMFQRHTSRPGSEPIVLGDVEMIDVDGNFLTRVTTERNSAWYLPLILSGIAPMTQQGTAVRAEVVEAVGLFNPRFKLTADADFWVRCLLHPFSFKYYPIRVARYRIQPNQLSRDVDGQAQELAQIVATIPLTSRLQARKRWARIRYRLLNLPRYLERWRHIGFRSSRDLFEHSSRGNDSGKKVS